MPQNYMQPWTTWNDLKEAAKKVYKGKTYEDSKTGNLYSFQGFLECAVEGQVHVKNLTTGAFELLPCAKWFSLEAVAKNRPKRKNSQKTLDKIVSSVKKAITREVKIKEEQYHQSGEAPKFRF